MVVGEESEWGKGDCEVDQMLVEILVELKARGYRQLVQEATQREQQREQIAT